MAQTNSPLPQAASTPAPAVPPTDAKAAQRDAWDRSAAGWDAHTPALRRWLRAATDAMLDMAGVAAGARVLDVAAGAGDQTLDIAQRVGEQGHVVAVDLSPAIVALGRARCRAAGVDDRVTWRVSDAEALALPAGDFDAAVSRLGLMLMPNPLAALRAMHAALRPGGGVCAMVFGRPERNPCVGLVMRTALQHAGLPPPEPGRAGTLFSLGAPGRLDALLREAGFAQVATTWVEAAFELPSAADYVAFLRASASPVQQMLAALPPARERAAWEDIEAKLACFRTASGWAAPNELALTAGRR